MLFLRDEYAAMGEREIELDDAIRDVYAPAIADDDARLAWYLYSTHGAGDAYYTIVITALRDGDAWERLSRRLRYGDLEDWATALDTLTYSSHSSLMVSTDWSPLAGVDLDAFPVGPAEHEVSLFREDTLEGIALDAPFAVPSPGSSATLTCLAGFAPLLGSGPLRILYGVAGVDELEPALAEDTGWNDWSGSLTPTLPSGARRSSRMLRDVSWSPMPRP
jgi:hypothetical protein